MTDALTEHTMLLPPVASAETPTDAPPERRTKLNYIGSPACLLLDQALMIVQAAFPDSDGIYQVGSSLTTPDWRDIDVRLMLPDDDFERLFGNPYNQGRLSPLWTLVCSSTSLYLSKASGLPIDFQIQATTRANHNNKGRPREPLAIWHPRPADNGA